MPAGKSSNSSGLMVALIVFVVLFIISATFAVILYTKHEDQRDIAQKATEARNDVITSSQYSQITKTVGKPLDGKTYTETLITYVDQLCEYITGYRC